MTQPTPQPTSPDQPVEDPWSTLTITVRADDHGGGLASVTTTGEMADQMLARRFYSLQQLPEAGYPPRDFWAVMLGIIASYWGQASGVPDDL